MNLMQLHVTSRKYLSSWESHSVLSDSILSLGISKVSHSYLISLIDVPKSDQLQYIIECCQDMPHLNQATFLFLIEFFNSIVVHAEKNKVLSYCNLQMTLHNLATILTPNLFRPFEITPNDLIYASQLVEVLKIMCQFPE